MTRIQKLCLLGNVVWGLGSRIAGISVLDSSTDFAIVVAGSLPLSIVCAMLAVRNERERWRPPLPDIREIALREHWTG